MASQIQDGSKQDLRNVMVTHDPLPPSPLSPELPHQGKELQGFYESAISKRKQQQSRLATAAHVYNICSLFFKIIIQSRTYSPELPHQAADFQGIYGSAISKRKQQQRRLATTASARNDFNQNSSNSSTSSTSNSYKEIPKEFNLGPQLLAIDRDLRPRTSSNARYSEPDPDDDLRISPVTDAFGAPFFCAWSSISKKIIFLLVILVFFIIVLFSLAYLIREPYGK